VGEWAKMMLEEEISGYIVRTEILFLELGRRNMDFGPKHRPRLLFEPAYPSIECVQTEMRAIFVKKVEFSYIEIKNFRIRIQKIPVLTGNRTAEDLKN
jgi:hypothetical protein